MGGLLMLHTRAYVGVVPADVCSDCGIDLPANYGCSDCKWETFFSIDNQSVVEICVQLCREHVLDFPAPVRIKPSRAEKPKLTP
jgi:hypothetical protein